AAAAASARHGEIYRRWHERRGSKWATARSWGNSTRRGDVEMQRVTTRRRVVGAGAAGAVLAACAPGGTGGTGGGGAGDAGGPVKAPSQSVTISIWHQWDKVRQPPFEKVLNEFQAKHPTVK